MEKKYFYYRDFWLPSGGRLSQTTSRRLAAVAHWRSFATCSRPVRWATAGSSATLCCAPTVAPPPPFLSCLLQIIMSGIAILHTHYQPVMTPPQLATQCVADFLIQSLYISPILHKHTTFLSWCCTPFLGGCRTTFLTQILAATRPCLSFPSRIYSKNRA